jgi:hypothetical protein
MLASARTLRVACGHLFASFVWIEAAAMPSSLRFGSLRSVPRSDFSFQLFFRRLPGYLPTMNSSPTLCPQIREDVLRDPRYPVHQIADQLLPYLQVLVAQFHPEQVILFGSYAYGEPTRDSDVDLLILTDNATESPLKQRVHIRQAWWNMPRAQSLLPFDLLVVSPERHRERLATAAGFYDSIVRHGLRLV